MTTGQAARRSGRQRLCSANAMAAGPTRERRLFPAGEPRWLRSGVSVALLVVLVLVAPSRWSPPEVARSQDSPATAGYTRLPGQIPSILSQGTPAGALPVDQVRTLAVVLSSSDPAGLLAFVRATSDPTSPSYQQWLTADAWTARFGPTVDTAAAVASYLSQGGLTILDEAPN